MGVDVTAAANARISCDRCGYQRAWIVAETDLAVCVETALDLHQRFFCQRDPRRYFTDRVKQ